MKIKFLTLAGLLSIGALLTNSCTKAEKTDEIMTDYNISLAQWSLHKSFFGESLNGDWDEYNRLLQENSDSLHRGTLKPIDFPAIAK